MDDQHPQSLGKAFLTGVVLLLPLFIIAIAIYWLFRVVTGLISPLTNILTNITGLPDLAGHALVLVSVLGLILLIGIFARTTIGSWLHPRIEMYFQRVTPGYRMLREMVQHLFGDRDSPFAHGSVALVQLYGPNVAITVTGIVTSRHDNGVCTVFVPTGPNPTSGFIYHVPAELIQQRPDVRVDEAIRTIIACGMGTGTVFHGPPPTQLTTEATPSNRE